VERGAHSDRALVEHKIDFQAASVAMRSTDEIAWVCCLGCDVAMRSCYRGRLLTVLDSSGTAPHNYKDAPLFEYEAQDMSSASFCT
jgi:hypothetical protein